jgi:N-methylhydantoinase A
MKLAFDTGGTFTDFALVDDAGRMHVHKVLSTPGDPALAVLQGIDELLARLGDAVARDRLHVFGATTVVTNTVLERRGAATAFLTTEGFRDILRIRTEGRYELYDLKLAYPEPLVSREWCFGVPERMAVDGKVLRRLDDAAVRKIITGLRAAGIQSVAVCLLHAYKFPAHERRIGKLLARQAPELLVSLSSDVCPEVREFDRASTTVVNAYTEPLMTRHAGQLGEALRRRGIGGQLLWMTSSGGVVPSDTAARSPVRLIESGPAAGAMAAAEYGAMAGERSVLSFDMGGTTAKLCLVPNGAPMIGPDMEVARQARFKRWSGFPLKIQSIQMIEIGAGGGSIASIDQLGLLRIGPRSSGAEPGPACYGRGGTEPTVTDADLLLGYLDAASFLGGAFKLHPAAAAAALGDLADHLGVSRERCAFGIHDLVNENMSKAAAMHAVDQGVDPRSFPLVAFGGAGPVHAYGVARKLGIAKVVCPLGAGITSAIGLLVAPVASDVAASLPMPMSAWNADAMRALLGQLVDQASAVVASAGVSRDEQRVQYSVDMRHVGQGHEINVKLPALDLPEDDWKRRLLDEFYRAYSALYGRTVAGSDVEAITWRVRVGGDKGRFDADVMQATDAAREPLKGRRSVYFDELGGFVDTKVFDHYALSPGVTITGPAIVEQRESTAVIGPRATATIDGGLNLVMRIA